MLQRAASNAYSWWWASHIRTKQSKWLDGNLQEMEDIVKKMLKLIETNADSFAKRAELYFKRRPELISFVEDAYKAYRSLADRYDHISGELHKANHTIATAFPERVQYAMLDEEEDTIPKAITPIDPSKINRRTVEGLMNKKKESESSTRKARKKSTPSPIDKEKAQEDISKLQKGILVLQTEKEFIKSSYESGIAKYWEIEKQIMEMQEEVCCLQDEFSTSAVIEDEEARAIMTSTVLKSCDDTIVNMQEQRKKSLEQAKVESERTKIAKAKVKALRGEYCQSEVESTEMSDENTEMTFAAENMEEDYSLNKMRTELQSVCEKIKEHFKMNPESSVIEIAEKIEELANKVITLELTVSSHAVQINRLTSENDELEKCIQSFKEDKSILIDDPNELSKRFKEAEDEIGRVQAIKKIVHDEEANFCENYVEAQHSLNGVLEKLQPPKPLENACVGDASPEEEVSAKIHDMKGDLVEEIHTSQELGSCLEHPSQVEAGSRLESASEDPEKGNALEEKELSKVDLTNCLTSTKEIMLDGEEDTLNLQQLILSGLEGKENILLSECTSILRNYKETKRRLSEVEKKNEDYLRETMALIGKLKNDIAMKDEEIRLLRQTSASAKISRNCSVNTPVEESWHGQRRPEITRSSAMVTEHSKHQAFEVSEDLNIESAAARASSVVFRETRNPLSNDVDAQCINEPKSISPVEEKFRRDINSLLDESLEFWLKFSTSFHLIREFKAKYEDLQADISKLKSNKIKECTDNVSDDQASKPESARITTRLRELKTELHVWLEQGALLSGELQGRLSSLCDLQEEISSVVNMKPESGEALFTPFQAGSFQGEVMNMKQENGKVASELQVGIDQLRELQAEIEEQLSDLYENFQPFMLKSSSNDDLELALSRNTVPLRNFLFGVKPKKPSLLSRIQHSKLRAGRRKVDDRSKSSHC
ncbi:protein NETWORKED 2D-like [Musa acuminata AAA Group]|uniref:protein NETWORKED 2D-like n=1 Tax=Musa acuminata AAA Group TaxID=214697 RepID=UPI0031E1B596